jgi:arginine-tRNA-protein transferase
VKSRVVEYYRSSPDGALRDMIAVCLTDVLNDGVSMVYSFFDPDLARQSLGAYIILDHVEIAREAGLPYVYLGYWVPGSPKMNYKARYRPLELYFGGQWTRMTDDTPVPGQGETSGRTAIRDQVAAIELPSTR